MPRRAAGHAAGPTERKGLAAIVVGIVLFVLSPPFFLGLAFAVLGGLPSEPTVGFVLLFLLGLAGVALSLGRGFKAWSKAMLFPVGEGQPESDAEAAARAASAELVRRAGGHR